MASAINKVAIFTDDPGWHGRVLTEALKTHGLQAQYVSLCDCSFLISDSGVTLDIPGFNLSNPLAAYVRGVPGGSLEQVIKRLNVLHYLSSIGVAVFNEGRAIERTVDKSMTSVLLSQAGIPIIDTWVSESRDEAIARFKQERAKGHQLVIKPMFGSQGVGVQMFDSPSQLDDEQFQGLYYLQRYLDSKTDVFRDIRVLVINGRVESAMIRQSEHWITNRTQGATCEALTIDAQLAQLAVDAVKACDIDYAGVDIMFDMQGKARVIEVNSIPAWWGLQKVTNFDIASRLIDAFCAKIARLSTASMAHQVNESH